MNKMIKFGVPATLLAMGVLMGCNTKPKTVDLANDTTIQRIMNDALDREIESEYGSLEEFNKQRKALGIDPTIDKGRALAKLDSIKYAPLFKEYNVHQPSVDAPQSEQIEAVCSLANKMLENNTSTQDDIQDAWKRIDSKINEQNKE